MVAIVLICTGLFSTVMETELFAIYPDNLISLAWAEVVEEAFNYNIISLSLYMDDFESLVRVGDNIKNVDSIFDYLASAMAISTVFTLMVLHLLNKH